MNDRTSFVIGQDAYARLLKRYSVFTFLRNKCRINGSEMGRGEDCPQGAVKEFRGAGGALWISATCLLINFFLFENYVALLFRFRENGRFTALRRSQRNKRIREENNKRRSRRKDMSEAGEKRGEVGRGH